MQKLARRSILYSLGNNDQKSLLSLDAIRLYFFFLVFLPHYWLNL